MQQWAVDEKDEFIDEGPKIGQYDSPQQNLDVPGTSKKDKKDKSVSKKQSMMTLSPNASQANIKSKAKEETEQIMGDESPD